MLPRSEFLKESYFRVFMSIMVAPAISPSSNMLTCPAVVDEAEHPASETAPPMMRRQKSLFIVFSSEKKRIQKSFSHQFRGWQRAAPAGVTLLRLGIAPLAVHRDEDRAVIHLLGEHS